MPGSGMKAAFGRIPALEIFGEDYPTRHGTSVRDYIHVLDPADAHAMALERIARRGGQLILDRGLGVGSTVNEVVLATGRALGRSVPAQPAERRAGDPPAIWADATLAERTPGWRAHRGLAQIVERAARWHAAEPDGLPKTLAT